MAALLRELFVGPQGGRAVLALGTALVTDETWPEATPDGTIVS